MYYLPANVRHINNVHYKHHNLIHYHFTTKTFTSGLVIETAIWGMGKLKQTIAPF